MVCFGSGYKVLSQPIHLGSSLKKGPLFGPPKYYGTLMKRTLKGTLI